MKYLFLLTGMLIANSIQAQLDPIDTDRPDQTESVALVPAGWLQAEAGFNYEKEDIENHFLLPTLLTKYGISKRFEFRVITTLTTTSTLHNKYKTVLEPIEIGSKIFLFGEKNIIPATSFLFHLGIPSLGSKEIRYAHIAPNFRFTMQHTLTSKISLGYNLGAEWDGYSASPAYIYTLTLGSTFRNKWYSYIEAFGNIYSGEPQLHNIDGGISYLISNNYKVDISSGIGLGNNSSSWYIALGISGRLKLKK
jgi:hypothetical protein